MNDDALDPLIHVPTRLKIVATLAALPDGDTLSFTRLQDMIGLTPGNLIIHLRKLEEAVQLAWRMGATCGGSSCPPAGSRSLPSSGMPSPSRTSSGN